MKKITSENPYSKTYDLTNCDQEPIHIIQTVQQFACIMAISDDDEARVAQVSTNIHEFLPVTHQEILGKSLFKFIPGEAVARVRDGLKTGNFTEINPVILPARGEQFAERFLTLHYAESQLCVEIENRIGNRQEFHFLTMMDRAIQRLQNSTIKEDLLQKTVEEVKKITEYDRVMIYQFDENYNGQVVAEAREDSLEPYLGLHYPESDIPKQARDLFLKNKVRILTDVNEQLAFIYPSEHPEKKTPLNVSKSAARGVSPIHLEYLRNMGVGATLNVAIVEDGKLWGLIACHHQQKKILDYRTRSLIKFVGTIISGHLSLQRATNYRENILQNNIIHAQFFEQMNKHQDIARGLTEGQYTLLDYIPADGAVIIHDDNFVKIGLTPTESQIRRLTDWLIKDFSIQLFSTNCLINENADFADFAKDFSGVLSVNISGTASEYIIWFRQAQEKIVTWGGNPHKTKSFVPEKGRLSPRKSFEKWKEVVSNQAVPWSDQNKNSALKLKNDIKDILIKRFSQLKKLHDDLNRSYVELESFSYTVSHDLRSPLRGIEGFAQILVEDYSDKLDEFGMEVIATIVSSVDKMNNFIDDILKLSKLAKLEMEWTKVDVQDLVEEIKRNYLPILRKDETFEVHIMDCPPIMGDPTTIKQLFENLISNAIKYRRKIENSYVTICGKETKKEIIYYIKDNGIGFEMEYVEKIYEVFSRLVGEEEYEGTGIGLSIVKRVADRHNANITVESVPGEGTTFQIAFKK